jgi:hypothetical protein
MPQSFPDMKSLEDASVIHKFRKAFHDETEQDYRTALADHVKVNGHMIEAMEIRTGKGWDEFTDEENEKMLMSNPATSALINSLILDTAFAKAADTFINNSTSKKDDTK